MERLTKREFIESKIGKKIVGCNYKDEDCNDSCLVHVSCRWNDKALEKLKEYEDLEEQGLLLRLPVKTVYFLVDVNSKWGGMVMAKSIRDLTLYEIEQIDKKKYYSTREAAEAALKEME